MGFTRSKDEVSYSDGKVIDSDVESLNCCQLNVHKSKIRESRSQFHNHPQKNLFHRRSCTDMLCLLVFAGCLAGWILLGYVAISSTPTEIILAPTDSKSRRCGFDEGVKDKPNVFYFDLSKCVPPKSSVLYCDTPRVCVAECPKESFYINVFLDTTNINVVREKLICQDGFNKADIRSKESALNAVRNKDCAEWYLESKPIGNRCLPKTLKTTTDDVRIVFETLGRKIESTINGVSGKELFEGSKAISDLYEFSQAVFRDLLNIWPWIFVLICVAAFVSFFYILIMRWVSGLMVWLSIFASLGLLIYSSFYTYGKFQDISENEKTTEQGLEYVLSGLFHKKETWLVFFIASVSLLIIILFIVIFLRSRLTLAIELIKEGSKAVSSSWSSVIFPVFPWIIQIAVVGYTVIIFAYLMNFGIAIRKVTGMAKEPECVCDSGYKDGSFCNEEIFKTQCHLAGNNLPCMIAKCSYSEEETNNQAIYLQLYNLLMFLWSLFFASGFGQMVLASTFATYYWTFNKDNLPTFMVAGGVWRVLRYHLGTISFGSFLLALCNWIRVLIEIIYNRLNKYDNYFVKFIKCCCSCVFWCLNSFLKFLNKNAYIMCAIHGKNFCSSARTAFNLLLRNILRVAVLDRVTNFLFFLGKIMVTTALGLLAFQFFSNPVPPIDDPFHGDKYEVEYYFVPMAIICIVTYFITSLFFGVYSMAVDTIFLCALEDLETNDGSPGKPYFMSKNLRKILEKKNEIKVK